MASSAFHSVKDRKFPMSSGDRPSLKKKTKTQIPIRVITGIFLCISLSRHALVEVSQASRLHRGARKLTN